MPHVHNDYPHEPGTLYDCEACEAMFYTIVSMQGDEGYAVLDMIDEDVDAALEYLQQWDFGDESEHTPREIPWGSHDRTEVSGNYVMTWDWHAGFVSLHRRVMPR